VHACMYVCARMCVPAIAHTSIGSNKRLSHPCVYMCVCVGVYVSVSGDCEQHTRVTLSTACV